MTRASAFLMRHMLHATGRGKLTILLYHRVHAHPDPLFPSVVDARRFDEQMAWVASTLHVLPLPDAVDMLKAGRLPPAAACITFDDGYADNVNVALPIIRRHRLSATFFIASGFLDGGRMWNDTIIESMRRASGAAADLRSLGFECYPINTSAARRAAIDRIIDQVKYLPLGTRSARVEAVSRALRVPLPDDLMMTSGDVRALHAGGMHIGAHTVSHPILSRIDDDVAEREIREGREALEALVGERVMLFAYPNGRPGTDFGTAHEEMVRELGFAAALSTRRAAADADTNPYELPRFTPWGKTFLRFSAGFARNHLAHRAPRAVTVP